MTPELHLIGIDPGGVSGWCRITVPTECMFGDRDSEILEWDYGAFSGNECQQALDIARLARETQGLAYKVGPAIVCEDWDSDPSFRSADKEPFSPLRIGNYLRMLHYLGQREVTQTVSVQWLGDSTLNFQGRTQAKQTATDERLKQWRMYVAHKDIRDATRHAITALRRARMDPDFAATLWPYAASAS